MGNKYLTVEEVASALELTEKTVRDYIRDGKLKAYKLGTRWKITPEDVEIFLTKQSNIKGDNQK